MSTTDRHLQRRGGVYYFRMKVPADLRQRVGRAEIRKSLGTRELAEAVRRMKHERQAAEAWLTGIRQRAADGEMQEAAAYMSTLPVGGPAAKLGYWNFIDFAVERAGEFVPELDAEAMRLRMVLHRIARLSLYDSNAAVHRKYDWSPAGFSLLLVVLLAGPIELHRLATLAGMSRAAVSAVVQTLERDGLVQRRTSPRDQRNIILDLTPEGREAFLAGFLAHHESERAWAARLSNAERKELIRLLTKLADARPDPSFDPSVSG